MGIAGIDPEIEPSPARLNAAVLDPVEGLTDSGDDYPGLMRENLRALRDGLVCGAP